MKLSSDSTKWDRLRMTVIDVSDFTRELECIYACERYSVRDNGAVFRHPREDGRSRPADALWTFGKTNARNPYLSVAAVPVHRIVATAFHGDPPTQKHVVDHIDTNCRNNRPENLRWVTRLESVILNPITAKRIAFHCGSLEAFLADPSSLRQGSLGSSFDWMRTVSAEEGRRTRENLEAWAKIDSPSSGGSLGEWVFNRPLRERSAKPRVVDLQGESPPPLVVALTAGAAQRNWSTPSEFPSCPQSAGEEPIAAYAERLKTGEIFARSRFSESSILKIAVSDEGKSLWALCAMRDETGLKPWSLAQVTYEDGLYVHESHGAFFTEEGAEKRFTLAQGLEWTGGDSIDDYA